MYIINNLFLNLTLCHEFYIFLTFKNVLDIFYLYEYFAHIQSLILRPAFRENAVDLHSAVTARLREEKPF